MVPKRYRRGILVHSVPFRRSFLDRGALLDDGVFLDGGRFLDDGTLLDGGGFLDDGTLLDGGRVRLRLAEVHFSMMVVHFSMIRDHQGCNVHFCVLQRYIAPT